MKIKSKFDALVNVLVLVSFVSLVGFLGYRLLQPRADSYKEEFAAGKLFGRVDDLREDRFEKSVILILNTECKFCGESVGFYNRLVQSGFNSESRQVVSLFLQPEEIVTSYVEDNNLLTRNIPSASFTQLRVGATPTVVIINNKRIIERAWFGRLDPEQEQEVMNVLKN